MVPVSRTVRTDSIVDKMILCFTYSSTLDWMLPEILPGGRGVEIPLVAIVKFPDGKLAHGHI